MNGKTHESTSNEATVKGGRLPHPFRWYALIFHGNILPKIIARHVRFTFFNFFFFLSLFRRVSPFCKIAQNRTNRNSGPDDETIRYVDGWTGNTRIIDLTYAGRADRTEFFSLYDLTRVCRGLSFRFFRKALGSNANNNPVYARRVCRSLFVQFQKQNFAQDRIYLKGAPLG